MQKIGVVTLYGNNNIGNKLQTYAVMQLYRSLGYDVTLLNTVMKLRCYFLSYLIIRLYVGKVS